MNSNPYQVYQKAQVETASQGKLILMLYDGAIRFCKSALSGLAERDFEKTNNEILRAQAIINEFMISLDIETGGEVAHNLQKLYDYMYRRLITANVKKDSKMIEEVIQMLSELRQTWEEAIKISSRAKSLGDLA